jgi:hypothetical protein
LSHDVGRELDKFPGFFSGDQYLIHAGNNRKFSLLNDPLYIEGVNGEGSVAMSDEM